MKKLICIYIFLLSLVPALKAQEMRAVFVGMPDSIMPLLTADNRADCVDFLDAGMVARVSNRLDGKSELIKLTSDYLHLKMTSHTEMQMKLLPTSKGDTIICVVNTICAEARDSRIRFYKKDWTEVKNNGTIFKRPAIRDFFPTDSLLSKRLEISDIELVEYILSPEDTYVTTRFTMPSYMSREDSLFVTKGMRDVRFCWDGGAFEVSSLSSGK